MDKQKLLFDAMQFANWAHRNQKRKLADTPYIVHPFHVMVLLMMYGVNMTASDELRILVAAILHDTLEDNPEEVSVELIEKRFGPDVARIVAGVSLDPKNPDKRLSRQKILKLDWMTQIVKVADVLSNTTSIIAEIKMKGLKEVEKYFKSPISERIIMEREFLNGINGSDKPGSLLIMIIATLNSLDELELVSKQG